MRFKIDENLPIELAEMLHDAGYEASTVFEEELAGQVDRQISEVCQKEDRILVTLDLDFANIHAYPPQNLPGIIVLRVNRQDKLYLMTVFKQAIRLMSRESVTHRLWIVEETRIRIRGSD